MKNVVLSFFAAATIMSSTAFSYGIGEGPYRAPFGNSDRHGATADQLECQGNWNYKHQDWLFLPEYNNPDGINLDSENLQDLDLMSLERDAEHPEIVRFTFSTTTKKPNAGFISSRLKSVYVMTTKAPEIGCTNAIEVMSIRLDSSKKYIGMDPL